MPDVHFGKGVTVGRHLSKFLPEVGARTSRFYVLDACHATSVAIEDTRYWNRFVSRVSMAEDSMCEVSDSLRLCTCEDGEDSKPDWILERRDTSIPEKHLRGRVAITRLSRDEKRARMDIVDALNDRNCFDFEYAPQVNDVLRLTYQGCEHRFIYRRPLLARCPRWIVDTSNGLTSWRTQMVFHKRGSLGRDR